MSSIIINNKEYSNVPSVTFNKVGGGTATYTEGGGNPLKFGVLRPDAEKVQTYTYDKQIVRDESITIPAYTTTATALKASAALSPTYTADLENYNYYILERFLTYPIYSSTSKAAGRNEYVVSAIAYEVVRIPPNNFIAASGKAYASASTQIISGGAFHRCFYWSSGSAVKVYTSAAYGCYQAVTAPTISSGVITINSPVFNVRGNGTYYSSTYWGFTTDIRYQYIIEIYRAATTDGINGWSCTSQMMHNLDSINNNNWTLT